VYATLLHFTLWDILLLLILIKRKDNMSNETLQSINHLDSLKAVKVALDMNKAQDKTIDMLVKLVATMDGNMKLLATKVLELEEKQKKTIEELSKYERSKSN
jgi:hypothetical protein